jgi:hypothetical protein
MTSRMETTTGGNPTSSPILCPPPGTSCGGSPAAPRRPKQRPRPEARAFCETFGTPMTLRMETTTGGNPTSSPILCPVPPPPRGLRSSDQGSRLSRDLRHPSPQHGEGVLPPWPGGSPAAQWTTKASALDMVQANVGQKRLKCHMFRRFFLSDIR